MILLQEIGFVFTLQWVLTATPPPPAQRTGTGMSARWSVSQNQVDYIVTSKEQGYARTPFKDQTVLPAPPAGQVRCVLSVGRAGTGITVRCTAGEPPTTSSAVLWERRPVWETRRGRTVTRARGATTDLAAV